VPYVENQYTPTNKAETAQFWHHIVEITNGIVSANGFQAHNLQKTRLTNDESFDIASLSRLKTLILPSLGNKFIKDSIRRDFARALFHSSFIYAPLRFDLPHNIRDNENTNPLADFYKIRPGRTFDPLPTLRPNMAYALIDTLFELAAYLAPSSTDSIPSSASKAEAEAQILLATAISPYLLLRSAVSLKSYIADQPLRGLMPQPTPARKALLHLLAKLVQLESVSSAIPDPPALRTVSVLNTGAGGSGSGSGEGEGHCRKHLEWVYPLVVRAVQVAGKERDDGLVLGALGRVLEGVGCVGV
jgi:hypothetical protein